MLPSPIPQERARKEIDCGVLENKNVAPKNECIETTNPDVALKKKNRALHFFLAYGRNQGNTDQQ